jgi:hypothetical protein
MTREEHGPPVPELARRMTVCSCHLDPARALVPALTAMPTAGIPLGDITADDAGGYHRVICPAAMGQDPLPAPPRLDDADPGPARNPHPAAAPARLLHPADHHRRTTSRGSR